MERCSTGSTRIGSWKWPKLAIKKPAAAKAVKSLTHEEAKRRNIPTAEYESVAEPADKSPIHVAYERRNRDLDPQLMWRGKDEQDASDMVVQAPPLYIQEKVHPKTLIDDLLRDTRERSYEAGEIMPDLFADFNGLPKGVDKTEFYRHDQNWSNRMILGDSLQVMASLSEREGMRGAVQCIFVDPPYGITFNSNFQWSTADKTGTASDAVDKISREPEQVRAFRDTWRDGIHSYLSYMRDRFVVARDLLADSGSLFVQIGDENVHRMRALMDEVFGEGNFIAIIPFRKKTMPFGSLFLEQMDDFLIWYGKDKRATKYRQLYTGKEVRGDQDWVWFLDHSANAIRMNKEQATTHALPLGSRIYRLKSLEPSGVMQQGKFEFEYRGTTYGHPANGYGTSPQAMKRLERLDRLQPKGKLLNYRLFLEDYPVSALTIPWQDTVGADDKVYVVQTNSRVVERCVLMTTDPGDLVLDPTCGSGTSATVAEHWGRRWITIDTSRVALALARARVMSTRYPFYLLADSRQGQLKEAEVSATPPSSRAVHGDVRQGFVYERVPHITLSSIASNTEIDVIWDKWQAMLETSRESLNNALRKSWQEWEVPQEVDGAWPEPAKVAHAKWCEARLSRQRVIEASIAAKAEFENLYDKPYEDKKTVRVAGPFTVESLSPHRELGLDENDRPIDPLDRVHAEKTFAEVILENLKIAGVQQAHKQDKITFTALVPWPGDYVCAEGRYLEGGNGAVKENRAGILMGPEFGTITRQDLVLAAREASDAGFDVLISCGFNYEAHTTEFNKLGRLPVLKARMNADLQMSSDLAKTDKANLFVVFGEPDIALHEEGNALRVKINGVDVYHPSTGEVTSSGPDQIACWFIDTDYNEESFFVRHAYFLGANNPYDALKRTLKAEIDAEAWSTLNSDMSRAFPKPKSGRIAVKVINHLGDEVMKVFKVA